MASARARAPGLAAVVGMPALAAWVLLGAGCATRVDGPPGVVAPGEPAQTALLEGDAPFRHKDHTITPLARFEVTGRVLGTRRYLVDREARLVPVDVALGWGPMSDASVLRDLRFTQMARAFMWAADELPIEREDIERHAANMHPIPADGAVARAIARLRPGQVVTLRGLLVQVDARDGWEWTSSLSREDTGTGACELVWVESVEVAR